MLLLISVILGLAVGLLLKGKISSLGYLQGLWFPIISMAASSILSHFPQISYPPKVLLISVSYLCILLFVVANRRHKLSAALIGIGSLGNFAVIALNGFRMPVSEKALEFYPQMTAEAVLNSRPDYFIAVNGDARLLFLGDVLHIPLPLVGGFVSIGDLVLAAGMLLLIVTAMRDKSLAAEKINKY